MRSESNNLNRVPEGLNGGEYVYIGEGNRNILYADANVISLFECDDFEDFISCLGNSFSNMLHPDDYAEAQRAINTQTNESGYRHGYLKYRIITKKGNIRYTESFGHNVTSAEGHVYYYVFITEISEEEYYNEYYNSFAEGQVDAMNWRLDSLTGLKNIGAFKEELTSTVYGSGEDLCSAAVFDIINLHRINREKGRSEGDKCIRSLVRSVIAHMPHDCSVYRGYDAEIIAVCRGMGEKDTIGLIKNVIRDCQDRVFYGVASTAGPFVHADLSPDNVTAMDALEEAQLDLSIKKMLTRSSDKSEALSSLVQALEEVDQDTEEHVKRTRKMGVELGKRLGLTDTQLTAVEELCLLHDIGKIAVPLDILNKPGKLTDAEWTALRAHADKGYQIALATKELKPIAECIRYHHERWDGKGYPAQLKEDEIPVLSRIISIVDAYDAMVNDRCYRKALDPQVAMQEIRDNAGTQFDPYMSEVFLQMLSDNPKLTLGKKTGGGEVQAFKNTAEQTAVNGNTQPVVYCEYKLDVNDIITEVGPSFESITGFSPEDALGKMTQYDLIPKEDIDDYMIQVGNQFSKSDTAFLRHRILRKDGAVINVICHGTRQFDSATRSLMSTIQIYEV